MVEKSDAASDRLGQLACHQTFEAKKQTLLPSIESGRLTGESLSGVGRTDVPGCAPKFIQERNHAGQSHWGAHRSSRLSGTTGSLRSDELSSTATFPIKRGQYKLSADKYHRRLATNDKTIGEEQKHIGQLKVRKSLSTAKLSMEPLQFPVVNLKSPLPKVGDLYSPSTQQDVGFTTGQTSNKSWEPFSCVCKHCGLKFGKHSITIHEKKCSGKQKQNQTRSLEEIRSNDNGDFGGCTSVNSYRPQPVARIITIGLGSSQYDEITVHAPLPPRPETQTLRHSSLRDSGYGLPYVPSVSGSQCTAEHPVSSQTNSDTSRHGKTLCDTSKHRMTLCDQCGRVVATDRIKVHSRLCKPELHSKVNTNNVKFPSTCNLLKVERSNRLQPKLSVKKPPAVVCYICGREYGTKSISIHEPQCLRKFELENRKLPINKRKPLPKKLVEEKTKVARFVSMEDELIVVSGRSTDRNPYEELVDETMDFIFQQCYSDFERELVPCKRCGRKFAPDRHKIHEPNCNAKPLSGRK